MKIFDNYAFFYDNYYASKSYEEECDFLLDIARRHSKGEITRVLDMGCGTGGHAMPLSQKGLEVVGFDMSDAMILQAKEKVAAKVRQSSNREFCPPLMQRGDVRTYRDGSIYDLCISMFAVMGYLTSNEDFLAGLRTARAHLRQGGLFIFDVWFGPAVLLQKPEQRFQEFHKADSRILRFVRPELDAYKHVTRVHYRIVEIQQEAIRTEVEEMHEMRYFFAQELRLFLHVSGFDMIAIRPFMGEEREPTPDDWNICVVAMAVDNGFSAPRRPH